MTAPLSRRTLLGTSLLVAGLSACDDVPLEQTRPGALTQPSASPVAGPDPDEDLLRAALLLEATQVARLDRVAVPCGPILTVERVFENEQVLHTGQKQVVQHPVAGEVTLAGFPYHFSEGELTIDHVPPTLGQQTREVLAEAGYSEDEIEEMISSGAAAAS